MTKVILGIVAGIGFTMSIFITVLGFERFPELIEPAKIGILLSSIIAAIAGALWFLLQKKRHNKFTV